LVSALAPLAKDVVIAGHDRDDVAALIFPDLDACRPLAGGDDLDDPKVREAFRKRLAAFAAKASGSASRVERILLLADPPSLDAGEITDKGSLNQRAVLRRRAEAVAALYNPESETTIKAH
jgi:feruloyl-CoA synthase